MKERTAQDKILIVDDSEEIRQQLKWGLLKDYAVVLAADRAEAQSAFQKHKPRVVTLDLGLPPHENSTVEGFACLGEIIHKAPQTKVIVITGQDDRVSAFKAIEGGAYDFYQKPVDLQDLKVIIQRAFHLSHIEDENRLLQSAVEKRSELCGMVGQCPELTDVFTTIRKVATTDASVLIIGESGTGKELVARAIHDMSLRKEGPFIPINCGAIPENLLEAELFGHEKGSFTGASTARRGKVEYAERGTLFLDEIGELPAALQVKLLRFLQEKTIQHIGGREDIPVDTRIIAATNRDITREIEKGTFREDLYYRIGVVTIRLPRLKDRGDDILILANLFLKRYGDDLGKKLRGFSAASIEAMRSYDWPGNVRELQNRIQRAVIMTETSIVEAADLGFEGAEEKQKATITVGLTLREMKDRIEKDMVIDAIDRHGGNIVKAAEELGVSRPTLYDLIKKHSLYNLYIEK
ncbi:MAG TPA: PEP-CTERM-box response regulator transcription factor [Dissulfurispiraceae bacterium]|nr:PEP-CTERM-box response regulator transcription factor [Dissulfurispiraceae bacterium]